MEPRIAEPRIAALDPEQCGGEAQELLAPYRRPVMNIFRTFAHHPKLFKRWSVFAGHVLNKQTLPEADREIVILRIGWLCQAAYEWQAHVRIAKRSGLGDADIEQIKGGPGAADLDPWRATLMQAVDELRADTMISDGTWGALSQRYSTEQLMDLVFTVGQYNLVCMALNSFGVQPEVRS